MRNRGIRRKRDKRFALETHELPLEAPRDEARFDLRAQPSITRIIAEKPQPAFVRV